MYVETDKRRKKHLQEINKKSVKIPFYLIDHRNTELLAEISIVAQRTMRR